MRVSTTLSQFFPAISVYLNIQKILCKEKENLCEEKKKNQINEETGVLERKMETIDFY